MHTIVLQSLSVENFMSIESATLEIKSGKVTSIKGINNDDDSTESNGSGKSALMEAFVYCVTGNSLRQSSNKKLVRRGEESGLVDVTFKRNAKESLRVCRELKVKGKSGVEVFVNGKLQEQLIDLHPRESNKFITEWIGISYEDLINTYIIHKDKYKSFLSMTDTDRKDFISRFCGVDVLDGLVESIGVESKEKDAEIVEKDAEVTKLEGKKEALLQSIEQVDDEKGNEEDEIKGELESLKAELKKVEGEVSEGLDGLKEEVAHLSKEKDTLVQENVKTEQNLPEYEKELESKAEEISSLEDNKLFLQDINQGILEAANEREKDLLEFEAILNSEVECPKCSHEFSTANEELSTEDLDGIRALIEDSKKLAVKDEKEIVKNKEKIEKGKSKISDLKSESTEIKINIRELKGRIETNNKKIAEIDGEIAEIEKEIEGSDLEAKKAELEADIKSYKKSLKSLDKKAETRKKSIQDKVKECEDEISTCENERSGLTKEYSEISESMALIKSYKTYLVNQFLTTIQAQANTVLKRMKTPIKIRIEGFKELATGETREKITILATNNRFDYEEVGLFSSGERSRIDIALIIARQNLIAATSGVDFNLTWLDEVCESVDQFGMSSVIRSLGELSRTYLVTTHSHPLESIDCERITVEKTNGVTVLT